MTKIFKYECGRLFGSKVYWGLTIITIIFGWQTLRNEIILGIANTAPFSPRSYGYYLARLLPFLCAVLLLLLAAYSGRNAREVSAITSATPVDTRRYALVRCAAAATAALLTAVAIMIMGIAFNLIVFGVSPSAEIFALSALVLLLLLALALGAGLLGGVRR